MSSQVQQVRKQVEQLRREASAQRVSVSQASHDLKKFVEDHQSEDILVNGFAIQKENPFKEKSSCILL
uniref:Guanine nucleotide-binding protein subunit gamma n=1 Tax=Plectus sambesii TaxID=2011161 RepID=A0A914XER8_9BILA